MTTTRAVALRINNLLIKKGMTRYALCKKIAMSEMTLKHIVCEETKTILLDTLIQIFM